MYNPLLGRTNDFAFPPFPSPLTILLFDYFSSFVPFLCSLLPLPFPSPSHLLLLPFFSLYHLDGMVTLGILEGRGILVYLILFLFLFSFLIRSVLLVELF